MTRDQLKAQFTGLMNRRDMTANTSLVDTFIDQAIMRVQRDLRVPAMEKSVLVTIASNYAGLIIPSDLLELKAITPAATNIRLRKTDIDRANIAASYSGTPAIFCRQGGLWVLGPAPATGDVIRIDYYAELSPLVAGTDENVVSTIAWDLIVYAALVYATTYYVDKRKDDFETSYQTILASLQEQADADELGNDAVVSPCLSYPVEDGEPLVEY